MRSGAIRQLTEARNTLKEAAHECARGVRAGCAGAPEKRNWFESGAAFGGGILQGAGEAIWDLGEMAWNLSPQGMLISDLMSNMTPEELAAKHRMQGETALAMLNTIKDDPVGFGKNLGKSLLDWDTWADDPAKAIGHLLPDLVAAIATGGAGAAVTRGGSALGALGRHLDDFLGGMNDARRATDGLGDLSHLDLPGDQSRLYSMMDDIPHETGFSPEQLGSNRGLIDGVLERNGVSRDDFIDLVNKPVSHLTDSEWRVMRDVRNELPSPSSDTVMQKVIPPASTMAAT